MLPGLVLAAYNIGLLTRYTRSAVLEVINDDYVRAARSKGMPTRIVLVRHILRAAMPSIITVVGLSFANVMTGTVLVETIFSWPGIGQYAYHSGDHARPARDHGRQPVRRGRLHHVNFIVDVLYGVIDPRLRAA